MEATFPQQIETENYMSFSVWSWLC